MSTKKKTTPKPAPSGKTETKKIRTLKEISADIKASIHRAQEAFAAALSDVKALAELAAQPKPAATPVKEKAPAVKEKADRLKGKAAPAKQAEPASEGVAPQPKKTPAHKLPSSVSMTPHEITLFVGSQPVRELAENDAKDLLNNSKVFLYRPMQFPDPRRYGVQVRVTSASVVQRKDPRFTRAPWTVRVTVDVRGDDKKSENWCLGVFTKNKADQE